MKLQQLRYALAVAQYKSINEAASQIFVSQPTISNAIKELEEELKIQIFSRSSKGIEITPEGTEFLGYARAVVEQADLLQERYKKSRTHMLRFVVSSQHYSFVVSAFINLVNKYGIEKYDFCIRETRTLDIIEDVHNMSADIGVIFLSEHNNMVIRRLLRDYDLEFFPLHQAQAHVFLSVDNPLANSKELTLEQLSQLPFLCFEQGSYSTDYYAEEIISNELGTRTIRVSDRATLFNLLIGLNGYTISSGIISSQLNPKIVSIPLVCDKTMQIGYILHKNIKPTSLVESYIKFLKKALEKETH
jgi:DNA-binding transcriptional LysR family regulator